MKNQFLFDIPFHKYRQNNERLINIAICAKWVYETELVKHTCHGIQGRDTECPACHLYLALQGASE